jgi:DNA-binding transcriptional LysR family regulator
VRSAGRSVFLPTATRWNRNLRQPSARHLQGAVAQLHRNKAGLDSGELDAGLTYLDNEPLGNVQTLELYREHYMLLTPSGGNFEHQEAVSWGQAAKLPLCLLTPDMQNRRIIDSPMAARGSRASRLKPTHSWRSSLMFDPGSGRVSFRTRF